MIKLTLYNGTTIYVNALHVVQVSKELDTTFIDLSTGGIHVKETRQSTKKIRNRIENQR